MAVQGTIYDVVVDIRKGFSTYGTWQGFELSSDNYRQLYIPAAHGFCVTSEEAAFSTSAPTIRRATNGRDLERSGPPHLVAGVHAALSPQDQAYPSLAATEHELPVYNSINPLILY